MCDNKEGGCACGCSNEVGESQRGDKEDVVIIDGVEYIRKNKKQIIEEPVINDNPGFIRIDE